jgi:hypothetical protein
MPRSRLAPPPEDFQPSNNAQRVGVLFVHGVGQTAHSNTLIDFGNAFAGWVARWLQAHGRQPAYREVELSFTPYDAGSDNTVPYAEMVAPDGRTWVFAEAWWANSVRPMPFTTMMSWSWQYLWSIVWHLRRSIARRFDRLFGNPSQYDAGWLPRFVDAVNCLGLVVLYPLIGILGYLLLVPITVLAQIPYRPIQDFVLLTLLRPFLQYNAADLRLYIEDEIQAANMRRRVADAIDWLTDTRRGDCQSLVIVAHSGGAWVSHGMLTDATYAAQRGRVRKLITLGAGLNKIWDIGPATLERLRQPLVADIFWVDFWASYDPVPTGWLEPPRTGKGWYPIYRPSAAFAKRYGLLPRVNPRPPDQAAGWKAGATAAAEPGGHYWPDSVRVVNFMDALTDHDGYFRNDEEVLRRVAAEIDMDIYAISPFWTGPDGQVKNAIPRRRSRVAWLGAARILGVVVGFVAASFLSGTIAEYIAGVGPIAAALSAAREMLRFLQNSPVAANALAESWRVAVAVVLVIAGAAIASLIGLVPFEIFRALWEWNDQRARNALLKEKATP